MCGIVGFAGARQAVPYLINGLESLEYRGYDSSGIALASKKGIKRLRSSGKIENLKRKLQSESFLQSVGIGHTRWATHGEATEKNAHPHISHKGTFAVVHNGIIENYATLKSELQRQGTVFFSDTDTEVIPNLIEKYYEGDPLKAVIKAARALEGSFSFAVLCADFPDRIICAKRGSPLVALKCDEGAMIASDTAAVSKYGDKVYKIENDEFVLIKSDEISFFSSEGKAIDKAPVPINHTFLQQSKGEYQHYMLKEIFQQPRVIRDTLTYFIKDGKLNESAFGIKKQEINEIKSIDIVACGSAYHAGLIGEYFIREMTGMSVRAHLASEYRYSEGICKKDSLVIIISQSGETADSLAALEKAKKSGAKTLGIVNVPMSSIATESGSVILTMAGQEVAVATTKAYMCQVVVMYFLGIYLSLCTGKSEEKQALSFADELFSLCSKLSTVLNSSEKISRIAKSIYKKEHIYFIGRNTDFALCMEGALKMKEISYIHCEAYAAGELKHGTISLIEKDTPVIAVCLRKDIFKKTVSNIKEVKARGARVIVVCCESMKKEFSGEEIIAVPDMKTDSFKSVPGAVALQLLSYHTARLKGCDIDKPRNLAKSVTVE